MTFKQRVVTSVVEQFRRPRGILGRLAGWYMGHRSSNRRRNLWLVERLGLSPTDRVLEIGFGPGIALAAAAERARDGTVQGVDHSAVMLRQAARRNRAAIARGQVVLRVGTAEQLPALEGPFDVIYAVNSHQFWDDLPRRVRSLRDLLRPGGRLAFGYQPRHPGATDDDARKEAIELTAVLEEAGFASVRVDTLPLTPMVICVTAAR